MELNKSAKEFIENIYSINLLNSKFDCEDRKLILTLRVKGESINDVCCDFKILEIDRVWIKSMRFQDFKEYASRMGFDGSWKSFFRSMELAVNKLEGGDMSVKLEKIFKLNRKRLSTEKACEIKEKLQNLTLTIFHPLCEDLKVKSDILFEEFHGNNTEEFKNLNFEIALELVESYEYKINKQKDNSQEKMKNFPASNIQNGLGKNLSHEGINNENRNVSKLELKKNVKRKFNSDLINPNIKKRIGKGVRFVEDTESSLQTNGDNNE